MTVTPSPSITPRRMRFAFDPEVIPVHWHGRNAAASHSANGMNLIFPDGERFFIRSVRAFASEITDPALRARIQAFYVQEAHHGRAHEAAFRILEAQGFEIASWLTWYRDMAFGRIEALATPALRLAVTAAAEHLTATLGHDALAEGRLDHAHPEMQALLMWHAAEEIEHKSVAFDVFQAVDGRWVVRVGGMVIALSCFLWFWMSATRHLVKQDPALSQDKARWRRDMAEARERFGDLRKTLAQAALGYMRPDFHPDHQDDYALAAHALQALSDRMRPQHA